MPPDPTPAAPPDPAAVRRDVELARQGPGPRPSETLREFYLVDWIRRDEACRAANARVLEAVPALLDECDRLRADSARLEFLERRECWMQAGNHGVKITFELPFAIYTAETLREAIDAAMRGER